MLHNWTILVVIGFSSLALGSSIKGTQLSEGKKSEPIKKEPVKLEQQLEAHDLPKEDWVKTQKGDQPMQLEYDESDDKSRKESKLQKPKEEQKDSKANQQVAITQVPLEPLDTSDDKRKDSVKTEKHKEEKDVKSTQQMATEAPLKQDQQQPQLQEYDLSTDKRKELNKIHKHDEKDQQVVVTHTEMKHDDFADDRIKGWSKQTQKEDGKLSPSKVNQRLEHSELGKTDQHLIRPADQQQVVVVDQKDELPSVQPTPPLAVVEEQPIKGTEQQHQVQMDDDEVKGGRQQYFRDISPLGLPEPYGIAYSSRLNPMNGNMRGVYTVRGSDGLLKVVDFVADHNGFRASLVGNGHPMARFPPALGGNLREFQAPIEQEVGYGEFQNDDERPRDEISSPIAKFFNFKKWRADYWTQPVPEPSQAQIVPPSDLEDKIKNSQQTPIKGFWKRGRKLWLNGEESTKDGASSHQWDDQDEMPGVKSQSCCMSLPLARDEDVDKLKSESHIAELRSVAPAQYSQPLNTHHRHHHHHQHHNQPAAPIRHVHTHHPFIARGPAPSMVYPSVSRVQLQQARYPPPSPIQVAAATHRRQPIVADPRVSFYGSPYER